MFTTHRLCARLCIPVFAGLLLGLLLAPTFNNLASLGSLPSKKVCTTSTTSKKCYCATHDALDASLVLSPQIGIQNFEDANIDGSDKTTYHHYHVMYGPALAPFMRLPVRLLEIGVENGKSLKLWERLFPKHEFIAGIGYGTGEAVHDVFKRSLNEKHTLYTGSQSDSAFLDKILEDLDGLKFDIIVDDGSHVPWHQVFTLEYIFDSMLKEGGVYIVEDIETSYWDLPGGASLYGYSIPNAGIGKHGSFVEKMKNIADVVNRRMLLDGEFSVLHNAVDHLVSHITFSQNCVVIHKKNNGIWANIDKMEYHAAAYMDPTRKEYKHYKATANWEVDGMERAF